MRRQSVDAGDATPWTLLGDVETNAAGKTVAGVDQGETSPASSLEPGGLAERFLHGAWWSHRARVLQAMTIAGESDKAVQRVRECGKFATVQRCTSTGEYRVRGSRCRHRFCRRCAQVVALAVADNLADQVKKCQVRCSHLVLTLKHRDEELSATRQRLYKHFKTLRNDTRWKRLVKGGAAFCQMHVSKRDRLWHVHFHIILEHHYFAQEELSELWKSITGDSSNVYIERIRDTGNVVREATRYVASPIDKTTAKDVNRLAQAMAATKGARLCFTFGTWRGFKLHERRAENDDREWVDVELLDHLVKRAYAGDQEAKAIMSAIFRSAVSETGPPFLLH